ncbi:MATE efflux family protein 5-like [Hibiscus syriacus]|uniref:MATE efflux family protein 5-like n=1 Tax=Hibiscus syriacus TaxID=106335 RepID=A0A6A3A345_HIBSY|nr:uncharacterized protein LOC120134913 [Hibiscus syriacus]KAE8698236.1 MATE efflux family protein 5-like [Hibiscus syriacus]
MSNKSPIFPMTGPQHFSDYGFDPQIDYFQVLEEARKHKKESSSSRTIDSLHFKLQKPVSKDEQFSRKTNNLKAKNKRKRWWWKNALFLFKWKKWGGGSGGSVSGLDLELEPDVHRVRARAFRASMSGPVYVTDSRSGSGPTTPCKITSRPSSGPLKIPFLSLRELNMEQQQRASTSAMPIYLVS